MFAWLMSVLNNLYGMKMPVAKYEALFTNNTKMELKADFLDQLDKWILSEVQQTSDHGASSNETKNSRPGQNGELTICYIVSFL